MFELRYAKMPEEPLPEPTLVKNPALPKMKKMKGVSSESSDNSEDSESSSSEGSDSESERANQLSYLQKQVWQDLIMQINICTCYLRFPVYIVMYMYLISSFSPPQGHDSPPAVGCTDREALKEEEKSSGSG